MSLRLVCLVARVKSGYAVFLVLYHLIIFFLLSLALIFSFLLCLIFVANTDFIYHTRSATGLPRIATTAKEKEKNANTSMATTSESRWKEAIPFPGASKQLALTIYT